jgi:hypothetical protein
MLGGNHFVPVHPQGIPAMDGRGMDERQAAEILAELLGYDHIHLMIREPERDLGDLGWKLFDLDAVELVHIDLHKLEYIEMTLVLLADRAKDFEF